MIWVLPNIYSSLFELGFYLRTSLTNMKKITLLFPDTKSLWAFAQTLRSEFIQINSNENRLTCACSDGEISRAMMQFNAEIVDEVEERPATT
jgi:hypothetical protein